MWSFNQTPLVDAYEGNVKAHCLIAYKNIATDVENTMDNEL